MISKDDRKTIQHQSCQHNYVIQTRMFNLIFIHSTLTFFTNKINSYTMSLGSKTIHKLLSQAKSEWKCWHLRQFTCYINIPCTIGVLIAIVHRSEFTCSGVINCLILPQLIQNFNEHAMAPVSEHIKLKQIVHIMQKHAKSIQNVYKYHADSWR